MEDFDLANVAVIWGIAALLLLISLVGGMFKFRGTEISNKVAWPLRIIAFIFSVIFFLGPFIWVMFSGSMVSSSEVPTQEIMLTSAVQVQSYKDTSEPIIDLPTSASLSPTTQILPNSNTQLIDPILKGYSGTYWNYSNGYVFFTIDTAGNFIFQDYNSNDILVSEGTWIIDTSIIPPELILFGYDYQRGFNYVGNFEVYDSYIDGNITVDFVNFAPLRLTFIP